MAGEVMQAIEECLRKRQSFLLSGGAGSGKTYTLMQTLNSIFTYEPATRVACITYTNVAADEIKRRSPYSKLHVSTIHDFLWLLIKDYQKNLKQAVLRLVENEKNTAGSGLKYSGDFELTAEGFAQISIDYRNYRNLANGVISHDDLLKVANYMFEYYPLLSDILCDKYDYVFIDEYQDTQRPVINIFLEHVTRNTSRKLCVGFFGDKMQSIYANGVGNIQPYVDNGSVKEIIKDDNFRCSTEAIDLLNKIRADIRQCPAGENKKGRISFLYSMHNDFDLECLKTSDILLDWNFSDPKNTKVLFLTHRLIAKRLGFEELLRAYRYTDNLLGDDKDRLALHLLKMGDVVYHFQNKNYNNVIGNVQYKIKSHFDKEKLHQTISELSKNLSGDIESAINLFDENSLVKKDDLLCEFIENHAEQYDAIKHLPFSQVMAYYAYDQEYSPYSTQHGIKGAEFDNVLVILDNGGWNMYNFKYYFEQTAGKESIIERTEKIFYVCCSRTMDNLVVFFHKPTLQVLSQAKALFEKENVYEV